MANERPSIKSFSALRESRGGGLDKYLELGAEFWVRWRHLVRLQERRYVAEDAALSVEDGDCVEAAEEPPELMPGESAGQTHNLQKNTPKLR